MTFMAKGLMMILLLLAGSACGLAQGYTGVREDAKRIYALLDHAGEALEEKHINREYTHSYIIGTKYVHFSPACLRYGADLEKLDQFTRAGAWISGLHDTYRGGVCHSG